MFRLVRSVALSAIALVLALPSSVAFGKSAPAELTHTHMETIARAYFESHNGGDSVKVRAFEQKYRAASALKKRSIDERIQRFGAMYAQVGDVVPVAVVRATDSTIVFTARAEKIDMWLECAFQFETSPPYKLLQGSMRPTAPPTESKLEVGDWNTIGDLIEQVVEKTGIPAIAAAVIEGGEIVDSVAVGVRAQGGDDAVTVDDLWHFGSITKSITATMIGRLVELGELEWGTTIGEALSDIEMREEYRSVTLEDLLHHRGGIQPYAVLDDADEKRLSKLTGSPTEIRAAFAAEVLQRESANPRGHWNYSNAGYSLAALIAERAAGKSWSELVRTLVFEPAGMAHSDFGWPATPQRPNEPRGHFRKDRGYRVQGLEEYPLGAYLAPAGDVCGSIGDLARYARMHLRGLNGRDGAVTAETFRWLHTDPPDRDSETRYAAGWMITQSPKLGDVHWHNGSAGTFYAQVVIYPQRNRAVVVAMNVGFERGQNAAERIIELINEHAQ